jgi:hypothetical protein
MIDITKQKIEGIKALRQFCHDTFGVDPGLKNTKEFADTLQSVAYDQEEIVKGLVQEVRRVLTDSGRTAFVLDKAVSRLAAEGVYPSAGG